MIGLMVKHMSYNVFSGIATRGHGVGIFCSNEKVTVFPEFYSLRNKAGCGSKFFEYMNFPKDLLNTAKVIFKL